MMYKLTGLVFLLLPMLGCSSIIGSEPDDYGASSAYEAPAQQDEQIAPSRNAQLLREVAALREAVKIEQARKLTIQQDQLSTEVHVAAARPANARTKNNQTEDDQTENNQAATIEPSATAGTLWVRIEFKSGQTSIEPKVAKALTDVAGKYLAAGRQQILAVQGFCDQEPIGGFDGQGLSSHGHKTQLALSQARADVVADILIRAGISRDLIQAQGFAASNFIADNNNKSGRDKNRRVDIFLIAQ